MPSFFIAVSIDELKESPNPRDATLPAQLNDSMDQLMCLEKKQRRWDLTICLSFRKMLAESEELLSEKEDTPRWSTSPVFKNRANTLNRIFSTFRVMFDATKRPSLQSIEPIDKSLLHFDPFRSVDWLVRCRRERKSQIVSWIVPRNVFKAMVNHLSFLLHLHRTVFVEEIKSRLLGHWDNSADV